MTQEQRDDIAQGIVHLAFEGTPIEQAACSELGIRTTSSWEICGRCRGNGHHDPESFSGCVDEMMGEDPDFRDEYMQGRYDVTCGCCNGSGKVQNIEPVFKPDGGVVKDLYDEIVHNWYEGEAVFAAEEALRARGVQF